MKISKILCFAVGLSLVLFSYWLGTNISKWDNTTTPFTVTFEDDGPIVKKPNPEISLWNVDTDKYGMYRVLKDKNDPSKGWNEWVLVPRSLPQDLFEARQARARATVARYNAQQKEIAQKQRQDELWYQRDQKDKHLASERSIAREKAQTALEVARIQARRPPSVTVIRQYPSYADQEMLKIQKEMLTYMRYGY